MASTRGLPLKIAQVIQSCKADNVFALTQFIECLIRELRRQWTQATIEHA
jgi:hypothetical protein